MEQRAIDLGSEKVSLSSAESELTNSSNVIRYPALIAIPPVQVKIDSGQDRRRRSKRFRTFIVLEIFAVILLVLVLVAGTSREFAQPALTMPFTIAILVAASAVAIVPVIFYGSTRQRHRYHRRSPPGH